MSACFDDAQLAALLGEVALDWAKARAALGREQQAQAVWARHLPMGPATVDPVSRQARKLHGTLLDAR